MKDKDKILEYIANKYLDIETLKTRNSDELDFYNLPVWYIYEALNAAFELGKVN